MFYLICYELRIQKSVFECVLTPDQYELLQKRLQTQRYLNPEEDQIRFYPMSPRHRKIILILGLQPQREVDDDVFIA
jgi:CRISPR-associated protein Cas2